MPLHVTLEIVFLDKLPHAKLTLETFFFLLFVTISMAAKSTRLKEFFWTDLTLKLPFLLIRMRFDVTFHQISSNFSVANSTWLLLMRQLMVRYFT
jgi:hypothetical protein